MLEPKLRRLDPHVVARCWPACIPHPPGHRAGSTTKPDNGPPPLWKSRPEVTPDGSTSFPEPVRAALSLPHPPRSGHCRRPQENAARGFGLSGDATSPAVAPAGARRSPHHRNDTSTHRVPQPGMQGFSTASSSHCKCNLGPRASPGAFFLAAQPPERTPPPRRFSTGCGRLDIAASRRASYSAPAQTPSAGGLLLSAAQRPGTNSAATALPSRMRSTTSRIHHQVTHSAPAHTGAFSISQCYAP